MKDNKIILDTHHMLGFCLADVNPSLGVASGVKLSVKQRGKFGAKVGEKDKVIGITIGAKVSTKT